MEFSEHHVEAANNYRHKGLSELSGPRRVLGPTLNLALYAPTVARPWYAKFYSD